MTPREGNLATHFERAARAAGWAEPPLPGAALRSWDEMVKLCTEGYDFDVSEYLNDLSIRELLQHVIDDPVVQSLPEYSWFSAELSQIDERFRGLVAHGPLVRPNESRWWLRSLPAQGDQEFVDDVRDRYGIDIEVIEAAE
ncbi:MULTISPECIES: hypothetical protein [unclassified Streptomyces]|uniref:hypothetical protein n=1 Tax=unclassified Streptomyces TaxID=2593676 RepID=UPI00136D3C75|nr:MULTISPECIES: hypothetical protein [unclassified Streptomyces]NEA02241.1 hypothetical protein [Streptomyces sp. SID10116]MYY80837.1 hypothetical protein [Streptomyces sp. SID335]MYZ13284.1 hypothetical protein [Streptomyces sp. SID337]NDZ88310.1 hypothetical protein [Streptomyces sp. SID10115]NEB49963.1 hypothetical protein [Streptomyces sp. SID339]